MPEPHTTAAGATVALGVVTVTGSVLGIHYDALMGGLGGGLVTLLWLGRRPFLHALGATLASAFLAGVFAPLAIAAAGQYAPWTTPAGPDNSRVMVAAMIGLLVPLVPLLAPLAVAFVRRRLGLADPEPRP